MKRRAKPIFLLFLAALPLALFVSPARADDAVPASLDETISKGLGFLASQQNPDGSFGTTQKPAITGLALLSFLSSGRTPNAGKSDTNVGKFGSNVRGAIDYLLSQAQPDGSFGRHEKPMYGQAIATLALAEACGVDDSEPQRKRIAAALAASVKLIVAAQETRKPDIYVGGWHIDANSAESELSVSGWNVMALRACLDAGINVPRGSLFKATKFFVKCYNPQGKGFGFQPGSPVQPVATEIAVLCLYLLDAGQRPEVQSATHTGPDKTEKPADDSMPFTYDGLFYAVQAAYQASDTTWRDAWKPAFDKLTKAQQADGGWPDGIVESAGNGRVYASSMAILSLSLPYRLLPIYQH